MNGTRHPLNALVTLHKSGKPVGITSVCSSNGFVLRAALRKARRDGTAVLIESTSNQVDQFGGYTGMTPEKFAGYVGGLAQREGLPADSVILGGDHLGPNVWQGEDSATACGKARDLVRSYAAAGFTKIHLDASMPCADDERPLPDETVAGRAADLCGAAEEAWRKHRAVVTAPVYVIGTEVPVPGGAREDIEGIAATDPADVDRVIALTEEAFLSRGLHDAWNRVIAVVVQPGVEFDSHAVIDYDRVKALPLARKIESYERLVYEAHSTDYQTRDALRAMVGDHFAILKVGPWLTFAFREAVYALAHIEDELFAKSKSVGRSDIRTVIDGFMVDNPRFWKAYYPGTAPEQRLARSFSFSDRIRYYWPEPAIGEALETMISNLAGASIPLSLLSQYLPGAYDDVREGRLSPVPDDLILRRITAVLNIYAYACGTENDG